MNKKKKTFKGGNYEPNGSRNGRSNDRNYRTGSKPGGNVYKTEGGYRNAGTAGIIPKVPDTIGSGKFGASADVASKLTFGKYSAVLQPGFDNGIQSMNNVESGTVGVSVGYAYGLGYLENPTNPSTNAKRTSGIIALHVNDYLGANNNEEKSPLNLAAQLNKQFIDTSLGEQIGFSSSDLGVYMGAVKSLWDCVAFIKRCINLSHNMKDRADYLTRGLYRAMKVVREGHPGSNPDPSFEIAANSAIYLERLNGMIRRMNTVPVPTNMKWLVSYCEAMYSQIFQDEDSQTSQFYVVMPNGFYYYDESATGPSGDPKEYYNGAELKWTSLSSLHPDTFYSIPELLDMLETMVQAVTTHTNSDAMAQKLLNAFGTSNTLQIPTNMANNELVPIVYDEDFLSSLENAVLVNELQTPAYSIDAAREMIVGRPLYTMTAGNPQPNSVMNAVNIPLQFHKGLDNIDDHAISNALRWHPYTSFIRYNNEVSPTVLELDFANNFGMQVPTHMEVVYLQSAGDIKAFTISGRYDLYNMVNALQDFKVIPIGVSTTRGFSATNTGIVFHGVCYNARRDTEVAITGENVANYFWALAEMVWDVADGQTQFSGQRSKMG